MRIRICTRLLLSVLLTITVPAIVSSAVAVDFYHLEGDITGDGAVDYGDLAIIAQYWLNGSCSDGNNWCSGADRNRSSSVDFADFSILANDWLQTTNSPLLELYPTINCIGIRLSYSGNPQHTVEYRLAGTSYWKVGHHLTAITTGQLAGSLFWLKPNSVYQVKITIGNQAFTSAVTTRADNPPESVGATYYVTTDGNDANPGTITNPFATIGKAASIVQAGDTVIVRSGIYRESINMTASGTLNNPIHFKSETPLGAVIDGGGSTTIPAVKCTGVSNIILEGFTLQNVGDAVAINNASYCWITGNAINCTDEGVQLFKNTATNNVIQYNIMRDTTPGGASSGGNSGVELEGGRGNIIRYNDVNGFSNGISAGRLFDLNLIDDETINPDIDIYGNVVYNIGDDALEPEGACINNRLWDNRIYDCFVAISLAPTGVGPAFVIRNTSFNSAPIKFHLGGGCGPTYVYHYTSFKGLLGGYGLKTYDLGDEREVVFRNCIFQASDSYVLYGPGADLDYNLWFYTGSINPFKWGSYSYSTLEAFQTASGEEAHGLMGDPLFVDAWGQDFNIQPASPARNRGVYIPGINDDYKGLAPDIGAFEFQENGKPTVNAGSDQAIVDPNNSVTLNATVTDDGLPNPPGAVTVHWTKQSGPGMVTFGDANAVDTTATFSAGAVGQYVLRLTASDSNLSDYDELTVTYYPSNTLNQAPVVNAGLDKTITPPAAANLNGTVTDDGLPNPPGAVTTTWTKTSGPGTVTFGDIHAVDTTASFSMSGSYVLRLTADDGALVSYDEITVTVQQQNQGPTVNAGTDQTIILPAGVNLVGTVTDDGLPNPPETVTVTWTKQSGPGTVTFADANAVDTTAGFSIDGTYVLRLTANDSVLSNYDEVTVTVYPTPPQPPASISYPASNIGWDYTVSWASSIGAISYQLERSNDGGGIWSQIYSGSSIYYAEHISDGSYRYRVKAANTGGQSDWQTGTYDCVVTIPPPPPWSETADYYIDGPCGSDLNAGTSSQPWKTLAKAAGLATAGQKVLVWGDQTYSGYTSFTVSGTSASPITFKRDPASGQAVLDGAAATKGVLDTTTAGFIVIDGFKLTNAKFGVHLSGVNCTGWVIKNCRVTANTNNGISIDNGDDNLLFNNAIYLNGIANNGVDITSNALNTSVTQCSIYGQYMGVYAGSGGAANIRDCIITNNSKYGVRKYGTSSVATTTYSDVWSNGANYSNTSAGTGCISVDPLLVNPAAGDFHLGSGSQVHNNASDGSDMGYRYSSSAL